MQPFLVFGVEHEELAQDAIGVLPAEYDDVVSHKSGGVARTRVRRYSAPLDGQLASEDSPLVGYRV